MRTDRVWTDNGDVNARVAWIHVAPVKALAIEERERVTLTERGVPGDREFCIVDETGKMMNGKRIPILVAIRPQLDGKKKRLAFRMPDGSRVAGVIELGDATPITISSRTVAAHLVIGPWSDALSAAAGRPLRLVHVDEEGAGIDRAGRKGAASLLSVAALDAMAEATQADGPVDPRRFRMTFGVAGVPAHAEDGWIGREVRIGEAVVVPVGNVGRCAVTTVDPSTGVSDLDTLGALARYRASTETSEALPFGVWGRVERAGVVSVGDPVVVQDPVPA